MSDHLKIGTRVRIVKLSDRELLTDDGHKSSKCSADRFVGKCGVVTGTTEGSGPDDPMFLVHCRCAGDYAFWREELEVIGAAP